MLRNHNDIIFNPKSSIHTFIILAQLITLKAVIPERNVFFYTHIKPKLQDHNPAIQYVLFVV